MLKHQGMELDTLLMQSNGLGFFDNLENSTYFCSIGTCILPEKFQNIDVPLNNKIQNPKLYPQELCRSSKEFLTYLSPNKRLEETKATECLFDPNIRKYGMTTSNMTGTDDFFMWPIELKSGLEKFNENCKTIYPDDSSNAAERRRKIQASNDFNREYEEQENVQERKKMKKMILIPEECQRNEEAGGSKMPPWHAEVIEDMAADLDGSLSNLGADLAAGSYNMSEALLSLPSLTVFKQEAPSPSQETLINQQNLQQNVEDIQDPNSTLHRLLQQNNFQNHLKRSSSNKVPEINEKKNEDCRFQYVLAAATSIATKVTEETLTYLNQGQSYEIKLKKVGELSNFRGKILKEENSQIFIKKPQWNFMGPTMAMFLVLHHIGLLWDELDENEAFDLISSGYKCLKEVLQYVNHWIQGEEVDSREIAEITQSFAVRVIAYTYSTVTFLFQYICALIVYVFCNVDSINDAIDFVRPSRETQIYKSLTALVIYEKPICFDYNPFHWVLKVAKILLHGVRTKSCSHDLEESCIPLGKLIIFAVLTVLFYHSYYQRHKPDNGDPEREEFHENENYESTKYEGSIKWEAGLVKSRSSEQEDHLSLKIFVNSNICPDGQQFKYDDSVASSTASICKIVSDVLSNSHLEDKVTIKKKETYFPIKEEASKEEKFSS